MKTLLVILFALSCQYSFAQIGALSVSSSEDSTLKVIPFSTIKVYKNNSLIHEGISDLKGNYRLENLLADKYDVSCEEKFHRKEVMKQVLISEDKITFVGFYLKKN